MGTLLEVRDLTMNFGGLCAIDHVSLHVDAGEVVALIGPNGAGKTTFFNCLTGIYAMTDGDIFIAPPRGKRRRINGMKTHAITAQGLARTFQNIRLFSEMTVLENVMIGCHCRTNAGVWSAIVRGAGTRREEREIVQKSYQILRKMGLADEVNELAKNLPYGAQRRLEIARALATAPFILLLDEPAAGMNPRETNELEEMIHRICADDHVAVLMIEHDMKIVMSVSDRIVVLDYGKKIAEGTPEEVRNNPVVVKAYLGEDDG